LPAARAPPGRAHRFVDAGDVQLAVREWGTPGKPAILMVHGYPDNSHVWDGVAGSLAKKFHVIAYDVRGAGASGTPRSTAYYALDHLVADAQAVIDAVSPDAPVHLVGHDWGSIQGWEMATTERLRGRIASYTSISGPCLDHVGHWMREQFARKGGAATVARQLLHSWYVGMFHLPLIAPLSWRLGLARRWPKILMRLEGRVLPENPTQQRDGVYGIHLYRANMLLRVLRPGLRHTEMPVHLIVPLRDPFVTPALLDGVERWAPNLTRTEVDAGHWLPLSRPQWLAEQIAVFVGAIESTRSTAA
jgi:pimeloyl-ACP methyl ester carboxylesterase